MAKDGKEIKKMYSTILGDNFPPCMEIAFFDPAKENSRQVLRYEKCGWNIEGEVKGLRYGENPSQEAAMYKLVNGNLVLGNVTTINPGMCLASDVELLQSGKHPGKINLTDVDNSLNILRYFMEQPAAVIVKHNNPCGVALGETLESAYSRAYMADRVAAFGGAIALNKPVDKTTAEAIANQYAEVVVAPDYEEGSFDILAGRKNLRIMRIDNIHRLQDYVGTSFIDFKSLVDGGIIAQNSFTPALAMDRDNWTLAKTEYKGKTYEVNREPTSEELDDLVFGWLVEAGVTSNSVIFVKDQCTVGIGTGEQDRVGVVEIARDKAYRKLTDKICFEALGIPYNSLVQIISDKHNKGISGDYSDKKVNKIAKMNLSELQRWNADFKTKVKEQNGGLENASMISDAFFPFRDGTDMGLEEGITSIIQPGGSGRDFESIEACNEHDATMIFTGERSFKH